MGGMEAALVSSILKVVGTKLAPLVIKEFSSIAGVAKDLQELQDLVDEVCVWLQTVGENAIINDRSSNWLKKLKDAAYDAEDLVCKFHIEAEKHEVEVAGVKNVVVKYLWTKPKSVVFERNIAQKIKVIKNTFGAIVKGRSDYSTIVNSMPVDQHVQGISKTIGEVPLWTTVDETSIFGRDQETNLMISKLIETNDEQKINIVSVIGLGGSGKTTLAKLVFNDGNTIEEHFDVLLWVHVSREFAVEKLVEKLFEAIAGDKPDHLSLQRMTRAISDKLFGKKFLLVLDDVWTEDRIHWERFMVHLKGGANGSSILLTTRSTKVAEAVDSTYKFDLPFLSEEESWKVFQQSFGMAMKSLDPEFQQIGIEIVNKCGGVPLAIKVVAGVLHGMKGIQEWLSIRDSNLLEVEKGEHRVFACLWLSYFHLPHHLKHCFTHCSIFPKGCVINRCHLISQWIAHGFINLTNQVQQQEDIGIGYFDSLLKAGFLQDLEQYHPTKGVSTVTICKMHDLVHDLAIQILQDEFVSVMATPDQIKRCRYLSLTSCTGKVDRKLFDKVRALYVHRGNLEFEKPINKRCCVRTIILKNITAALLPLFISKFELLGYLEISSVNCVALPEAISHCWNLQAIHVIHCNRLEILPESIGKLKKLRTLELKGSWNVNSLPHSIGGCGNLQSLYLYASGLKDIPDSIGNVEKLRVLSIVHSSDLQQLPSESFGKLCNLKTITLNYCSALRHLPQSIILLCRLEYIDLAYCHNLVELPEGIGNLKDLRVLNLQGCHKLCSLPAGCGQLTRLQKLGLFVVGDSTKHARISELENLDKLNGKLGIRNIKYVNDSIDALKAHLKKKNGIQKLLLDWYSKGNVGANDMGDEFFVEARTEEELLSNMEKDLDLLDSLEPPPGTVKLRIRGYRGSQLPCWMSNQADFRDISDTHMVKQSNPPLFSNLTKLVLENLPHLKHLRRLVDLPGITILKLKGMPKLVELLTATTILGNGIDRDEVQYCFPHLFDLEVSGCPKLNVKPYFPLSLKRLTLEGSNEELLSSGCFFPSRNARDGESTCSSCTVDMKPSHLMKLKIGRLIGSSSGWDLLQHLTGLIELEISSCKDLTQLPESMKSLTCLDRLVISRCDSLSALPGWIGGHESLQSLSIIYLPRLSTLPQSIGCLISLQRLYISDCNALCLLPEQIGDLCSLRVLILVCLPALVCLPESMQRLTSLQDITLGPCGALAQLPESLGELSALRRMCIQSCPVLTTLPRSIQRLTALERLNIRYCPELIRRCKEGVGEDWHIVSHIPDLSLQG